MLLVCFSGCGDTVFLNAVNRISLKDVDLHGVAMLLERHAELILPSLRENSGCLWLFTFLGILADRLLWPTNQTQSNTRRRTDNLAEQLIPIIRVPVHE